jgi:hypothetical protein
MKIKKRKHKKTKEIYPIGWNKYSEKEKRIYNNYGLTKYEYRLWRANNLTLESPESNEFSLICNICNSSGGALGLMIDHVHMPKFNKLQAQDKIKYIRGALCFRCNKYLVGMVDKYKNSRDVLNNLIVYFEKYKTKFETVEYELRTKN